MTSKWEKISSSTDVERNSKINVRDVETTDIGCHACKISKQANGYLCDSHRHHSTIWETGPFWARAMAEFLGVFMIVLIGVGVSLQLGPSVNAIEVAFAFGGTLFFCMAAFYGYSGGFFNIIPMWSTFILGPFKPKVPTDCATTGPVHALCLSEVVISTFANFAGAVAAAGTLKWFFPASPISLHLAGGVATHIGFGVEFVGTYILNLMILILTDRSMPYKGKNHPDNTTIALAIGFTLLALELLAFSTTGGSFNPIRHIAVNLIENDWVSTDYVYTLGPVVGGIASLGTYWLFRLTFLYQAKHGKQ